MKARVWVLFMHVHTILGGSSACYLEHHLVQSESPHQILEG